MARNGTRIYSEIHWSSTVTVKVNLEPEGLQVELPAPLGIWAAGISEGMLPLASQILNDAEAAGISASSTTFRLPNALVANWPNAVGALAKLPAPMPFPLDLRLSAGLGQPNTRISTRWM